MLCIVDRRADVAMAVERMEVAALTLPGAFNAEFALRCHGGVVAGYDRWQCEVEGDIVGTSFDVWGQSADKAIQKGIREAWRRVPPTPDGFIVVVPFADVAEADSAFVRWLWVLGLSRDDIQASSIRIDTGHGPASTSRRYLVLPGAIPD
jgi:hypothetical protein